MRPCREESVDFDDTENVYIEGDNLDVLKLLRETYLNKVKMIYIDPPYNTGKNYIYKNNFYESENSFLERDGQYDEDDNRLVPNPKTNGRFHTDWLNMMYSRLKVARDLLCETGYVAIAIDDNELYNVKKILDEVFCEVNYIGTIVTRSNPQGRNKNNIDPVHEYHLIYAKNISQLPLLYISKNNNSNEYGYLMRSGTNSRKMERPKRFYPMLYKDNNISMIEQSEFDCIHTPTGGFNEEFILQLKEKYENLCYEFILPISSNGELKVWQRTYDRVKDECATYIFDNGQIKIPLGTKRTPVSLWSEEKYSNVAYGTNQLKNLFANNTIPFDFSKSIHTVKDLISLNNEITGSSQEDIILDFFSGSATTAHAVIKLNAEDGGKRKFIMVQLPEACKEDSEAYKAGYKNICEIGKERIRRAAKKIKEDNPEANFDGGFRVLKLDSSNMKDVYYTPEEYTNVSFNIDDLIDNVKQDRTDEDLLFQVLLDLGIPLSAKIKQEGNVFYVNDNELVACFAEKLPESVVRKIADCKPFRAVFRDSGFENSPQKINMFEVFKCFSPSTDIRVI